MGAPARRAFIAAFERLVAYTTRYERTASVGVLLRCNDTGLPMHAMNRA